jgi:hypothetical protein
MRNRFVMNMMSKTNRVLSAIMIALFFFVMAPAALLTAKENKHELFRRVEDFSRFDINTFPAGWESRGGDGAKVYHVKSEGETYLEARAEDTAVTIAKRFVYDLKEYPFLSWQWRADVLPRGGDERYKKSGDSGAGIYVIFSGLLPKNIKYVWSASLPMGTNTKSPYNSKTRIVVLRNQSSPLQTWISEKVNVYEDYKRLFGEEPEQVQAIGIMTDSDNTHTVSLAQYKRIAVSGIQ